MLKLAIIPLAIVFSLIMNRFSVRRTERRLTAQSSEMVDPMLKVMAGRLANALDIPRIPVYIYEVDPINGLASSDGRIFITRGFYRRFQAGEFTADEMATVIAHEFGHISLGHSRRRMIDFAGHNLLLTAPSMLLSKLLPLAGRFFSDFLTSFIAARLSRSDEYAADEFAAALLTKAGIGTAPQISLFNKLEALTNARGGTSPAWLMSHPKTPERIAAIEKLSTQWADKS